ncbi:uncharacterized protein LOC111291766 isoform X2 [Durio zibethinus]|uniref:Uncharacterized protein LOC111291766 isoform X2 n=1 Tax=Durio zibethinus TaxID=66656 RepID=A0A6P5YGF3_DURZI|nr:uncharacterized protein LOC111291766 isoform X2 [Durio zibethinus]
MDLKGITWVGQVYQKFEAMCLEVEEVMYQDTVKYVEDQVQTVGASVKKFYSDVMQDVMQDLLLPSSSEPMKAVAASDTQVEKFAETLKKPNVGLKEATIKGEGEQLSEDSEVIADDNENAVNMPLSCRLHMVDNIFESCPQRFVERASSNLLSGEHSYNTLDKSNVENLPLAANYKVSCWQMPTTLTQVLAEEDNCDSIEQSCKEIESASESITETLNDDLQLVESIGKNEMEMRCSSSVIGLAEFNDSCSNAGMVSLIGCSINGDIQHNEFSDKIAFASSPGPVEEHPGQSNNWTMDTSGSRSSNVGRKEIETVLPLDKTRVDESCIMVNGAELHFHHQREGKHKPYQKKIRDAISSRMRSTRKKEYKQLALWYGDDVKSEQDCEGSSMLALKGGEDMRRSLTHDVLDSEWELL